MYIYIQIYEYLSTYIHTSRAAKCRGLFPSMSSAPTSAHADRSTSTTSECPRTAAQCRASMCVCMSAYEREGGGVVVRIEYCHMCMQGCPMFVCVYLCVWCVCLAPPLPSPYSYTHVHRHLLAMHWAVVRGCRAVRYLCVCIYVCVCMQTCVQMCMYVSVLVWVCLYVCVCMCVVYSIVELWTDVCTCIYTYRYSLKTAIDTESKCESVQSECVRACT